MNHSFKCHCEPVYIGTSSFCFRAFFSSIFTVRKRSCGKVIFLHLSVSHSVHRGDTLPRQVPPSGRYTPRAGTPPPPWQVFPLPPGQVHPPGQVYPPGRYTPRQVHPPRQVHHPPGRYTPQAGTPTPPRQSLQRTVRILLECFLVKIIVRIRNSDLHFFFFNSSVAEL